ncbi:MAG: hypothetical protein P3X22_002055 [Thermoprotei archaeon]|nr:hypothetical protein [Thermoprotei archaeon]
MSYPEYTSGYWYPNNFAEPIIWMPVVFAYSLMISGSILLFIAYLAYILNIMRKLMSLMLIVGLSMFLVILIGPLADLRAPDNAWKMIVGPRILPSDANPGFSLIAFQGAIAWPLAALISIVFVLLYFSYPLHLRYVETGNPVYRILSLGVSDERKYAALEKPLKILAFIGSLALLTWLVYPATLFMQTFNFVWANSMALPFIFFAEEILMDIGIIVLGIWILKAFKPEFNAVKPFIAIIAIVSAASIVSLLIQVGTWYFKFGGSPYYTAFTHLYSFISLALILYLIAFASSIISTRYISLSIIASLAGILGVMVSRWNFVVKAQEVSVTGLGVVEAHIPLIEYALIAGIFSIGIFLIIVLGSVFPVGFEFKRGEGL